ncbi:MAG: copper homeostasis protein CutC, partial [Candidatus Nanopelagicales bacterium]
MAREAFVVGPHSPLRAEERELVLSVLEALEGDAGSGDLTDAIVDQVERLELFGELLARYPSPLDEQRLGSRRRGLDTLVDLGVAVVLTSGGARRAIDGAAELRRLVTHAAGRIVVLAGGSVTAA